MFDSLLRAAVLAAAAASILACGFARRGGALPDGHASISCPNQAPGVPYLDDAGDATAWPDLPYSDFAVAKYVANLSNTYKTPLCYYSMQVLPSPPSGTLPGGNCTWDEPPSLTDVLTMLALGSQAMQRMQGLIAPSGPFRGSQCGGGSGNAAAVCAAYPTSRLCAPALAQQRSRWAVASNIVEITPATLPALIANDTAWRSSADLHIPAMASEQVQRGWGTGGGISFKVVQCADVPAGLAGLAIDCDTLDPATGKSVWDEAFEWWSSYKAPAWLVGEMAGWRAAHA